MKFSTARFVLFAPIGAAERLSCRGLLRATSWPRGLALIDQLGLHYLHAHQIATRVEEAAVRAAGVDWREYDRFVQKNVKCIGDERLSKIPDDLDTKPYRDEHDEDLLRRMLDCIKRDQVPQGFRKQQLKDIASELRQYFRKRQKLSVHSLKSSKAAAHTKRKRT
jgi:hypothetical protein